MHNIKKTSQKITIIAFILLLITQLVQPIVKAAIYDEEKYGKKPDGYIEITDFESDYASQKGTHSYYKYTDEDKVQHVVAVEEMGSEGNIGRYQVTDTINKSSGFLGLGKTTDPDVEKAKENINKNYGNSLGMIEVNKSATSTGTGTSSTDTNSNSSNATGTNSTNATAQGKRLSELDVKDGENKKYDGKLLKMDDDKTYVIYYIGNEAYGMEYKYSSWLTQSASPQTGLFGTTTEVYAVVDDELLKAVNKMRTENGEGIISNTSTEVFDWAGTEKQSQEERGITSQSGIDPNENAEGLAEMAEGAVDWLGGVLFRPFLDLLITICDAIINGLQGMLIDSDKFEDNGVSKLFEIGNYLLSQGEQKDPPTYEGVESSGENNSINIKVDTTKFYKGWLNLWNTFNFIKAKFGPETIFSNTSNSPKERRIDAFSINFFSNSEDEGSSSGNANTSSSSESSSASANLRKAISSWYLALRNLSIAGLLCVLAYMGIRILISATAADKAKYKQLLKDWLVALILLFTIHYIMVLTVTVVEAIINGISNSSENAATIVNITDEGGGFSGDYKTNLIGAARFQTQYADLGRRMPYVVMYVALVVYTVIFTVYYFRRALMMAFLTMIAPLVAFTYPIDKITDGKAQAFNAWIKEYVYNALIQPFHLIIYTVFVSNALNFAQTNPFYMIASLWFVFKAEKILRGFFGFNKASGTMGTLETVGLASILKTITGSEKKIKGAANDKGKQVEGEQPVKFADDVDLKKLAEGMSTRTSGQDQTRRERPPIEESQSGDSDGSIDEEQGGNYSGILGEDQSGDLGGNTRDNSGRGLSGSGANKPQSDTDEKQKPFVRLWRTRTGGWSGLARRAKGAIRKGVPRAIKGATKFGIKTAYTAGAGALAGAVALASGGDLKAALGATAAGAAMGGKTGDWINRKGGGALVGAKNRFGEDLDIMFDEDGSERRRKEANRNIKYNDEYYNYVRKSMAKANNGVVPTDGEIRGKLEEYRPFFEQGFDVKEAVKAAKTADAMEMSGTEGSRDYSEAASILAVGRQEKITPEILNDAKKNDQARYNMEYKLVQKGVDSTVAQDFVNTTFSYLERNSGVGDSRARQARNSGVGDSRARNSGNGDSQAKKAGNSHKQNLEASREKRRQQEATKEKLKTRNEKLNRQSESYEAKDLENGNQIWLPK